jgi:hypothetical protein
MAHSSYEVVEIYTGLRDQVLRTNLEATGRKDTEQKTVLAVLMETGYPEAVATLVAVTDGTASIYFSNGGGIIGGGEHAPVREASKDFLVLAQQYLSQATATSAFPLPKKGNVRFYFVTDRGVYTFEAAEDDLGYERHLCSPLFHTGHKLITAIREHTPQ